MDMDTCLRVIDSTCTSVQMIMLEEAGDSNINKYFHADLLGFHSALWTSQNPCALNKDVSVYLVLMRVQKLSDESHWTKIIFLVYERATTLSQVFWKLSSCFPPGKPWIQASLTTAHVTSRHLNGLWYCPAMPWDQQLEGKHPLNPCQAPRLEASGLCFLFLIIHVQYVPRFFLISLYLKSIFLSKSPCGCPSSVLISHLHCWNVYLMDISTSDLYSFYKSYQINISTAQLFLGH